MARIEITGTLPCGCEALRNARVLRGGERIPDVREYDTETRTATVLVRGVDGRPVVAGGDVVRATVTGALRLECVTHGVVG